MKKQLIKFGCLLILLVNSNFIVAQEFVAERSLKLGNANSIKEVIPVVSDNQQLTLILLDKYAVHFMEFDADFQEQTRSRFNLPETYYEQVLGFNKDGNNYHLFFSNRKKNVFQVNSINLINKTNQHKVIPLKLRKEKFLESLNYKGGFYIFTIVKNSSLIKLYGFKGGELSIQKEFDFSEFKFSTSITFPELYSAITKSEQFKQVVDLPKVDHNHPVSIEQASKPSKLYFVDGKVYITLDNSQNKTNLITIDLNDFKKEVKTFQHKLPRCNDTVIKTNSFLSSGRLFQIQVCRSGITIQSTDIETDESYANLSTTQEDGISFKNGPVIQEGSTWVYAQGLEKELVKPKQVLRKMANSEVGLSAYTQNDKVVLTIGGHKEVRQNSGVGGFTTTPGGTISTPGGSFTLPATTTYNPTLYGYNQYKNSRSVYFKSLLDQHSHNHIKGVISLNAFDQIREFEESLKKIKNETIFKIGDTYFFGYFKAKEAVYAIYAFRDNTL